MQYFEDFSQIILKTHAEHLLNGVIVSESDQIRDSERLITLQQVVELTTEDINEFYSEENDGTTLSD